VPIKGLHVAIEALRLLGRSDVGLIVLGDTLKRSYQVEDYRGRVEAIINKAGLTDQVRFLGHVDNAIEQMGACDIAVHTRIDPEAFGLVIIEAQAAGCAVIGTRAGGVPEIVEDGISGLLVKPQNPAALQQAIQYLLDDPPGRSRIAAEGRRRVLRYYGLERVATEVCTVYEELGVAGARPSTVLHGVPASDASRESSDG